MFTGITQGPFSASITDRRDGIKEIGLELGEYGEGLAIGASVAVNGVCLTVVELKNGVARFEVGSESARISNLGELDHGALVNVERSFRIGEEIGGHILSGHVAAMATITEFTKRESEVRLEFQVPEHWRFYVMPKGFVALNGCSLTVAEYDRETGIGSINLIPETLRRTTFGHAQRGDRINLEIDSQTQTIVDTVRSLVSDKSWLESLK